VGLAEDPITPEERMELRKLRRKAEHLKNKIETKRLWKKHYELEVLEGTYSPETDGTPFSHYEGYCAHSSEDEGSSEDEDHVRYFKVNLLKVRSLSKLETDRPVVMKSKVSISAEAFGRFNPQITIFHPVIIHKSSEVKQKIRSRLS